MSADEPEVRLLAGGNPQIAKGEGEGPVQRYIAAMPGWKSALGRHLDALVVDSVEDVHKAVKCDDRLASWFEQAAGLPGAVL